MTLGTCAETCLPLRAAVDVSSLSGGSGPRGIGRYLSSMLAGLRDRPGVEVMTFDERPRRWGGSAADANAAAAEKAGAHVFWSPAQHPPKDCPLPWVQTLHDLTPIVFPSKLTRDEARHWRRLGPTLAKADAIVCPSRSSARQGVEHLGLEESRTHVVYHGISPDFRPIAVDEPPVPYLLVVSAFGPHKGFDEAMEVVARLADNGYPHKLRIAGPDDDWWRKQLGDAREKSRHPEQVEIVGYVEDLVAAYNAAATLLCPSHAEGFGFPVAEAMACGTPVVAYDNTSLPEVVGDAGLLVPDGDLDAMTSAVRSILDSPPEAERLRKAGIERAAGWSWPRAAETMESIFRGVVPT
jgi:glycosyltransferase involved in cell wall biosynthesis